MNITEKDLACFTHDVFRLFIATVAQNSLLFSKVKSMTAIASELVNDVLIQFF